jgi:Na+/H+ antiporter NhaD/arsenite permease-like protein
MILILFCGMLWLLFGRKMRVTNERKARIMEFDEKKSIGDKRLLVKSLIVLSLVTAGFLLHGLLELEPATIALFGAALLMLLSGKEEIDHFFHEVEWATIFFFIGLFVLVGGLVRLGVIGSLAKELLALTGGDLAVSVIVILWASAIFSAFVDNIPFVATMIPLVHSLGASMPDLAPLWWALALGACLGGNGTLIGASANVVSAGIAAKSGYKISFGVFMKYGMPVMLLSLVVSTVYLWLVFL